MLMVVVPIAVLLAVLLVARWASRPGPGPVWDVYWYDTPIARLDDPRAVEMFWAAWRLTVLAEDGTVARALGNRDFWHRQGVRYLNPATGKEPLYALAAGQPREGPDRVVFRGLYGVRVEP